MIKRLFKDQDVEFLIQLLDENEELINYQLFDEYKITAYTTNEEDGHVYDRADIVDYVLHINASDIANLKNGILKLKYKISINDDKYEDGNYTKIGIITTRYFLYLGEDNYEGGCGCGCTCN